MSWTRESAICQIEHWGRNDSAMSLENELYIETSNEGHEQLGLTL